MDRHNGSHDALDVKYIRFPAVQPRYVIAVSAFSIRITYTTAHKEYDAHVKWKELR